MSRSKAVRTQFLNCISGKLAESIGMPLVLTVMGIVFETEPYSFSAVIVMLIV